MSSVANYLGPMLIGTFASVFAFGIMSVQTYLYFLWYKKDNLRIKLIVAFLFVVDAVSVGFNVAGVYQYLVSDFGNPEALDNTSKDLLPYPLFIGITAFVVQCFFGWRIQVLKGSRIISFTVYVTSFVQFALSVATTVMAATSEQLTVDSGANLHILIAWLSVSLFTDLLVTVTLVFWLHQNRTGFDNTDDVITRLIRMSVQTGSLVTSFAIAVIVSELICLHTGGAVYLAFGFPLSKIYANSLLSTLNVRRGWVSSKRSGPDMLTSVKDNRAQKCLYCDRVAKSVLSSLQQAPPPRLHQQSTTMMSSHDMTEIEAQKSSDFDSFSREKIGVLVESTSDSSSD